MLDDYFGLVEMVFSFGLIIGLCVWQLWALEKARKRLSDEQSKSDERG
ncbi:hypothetical protein IYY11_06790 [Methylocystis sp. H62]|nr:hypothetical protein [Methylocystis sp. H62]MBG0793094.1 hypothetical protein [Methylocystis sp. H62]